MNPITSTFVLVDIEGRVVKLFTDPGAGVVFGARGKPYRKICNGYIQANINKKKTKLAHRLIWESVHGIIPEGLQINHINGIKTDNRICNLELVTARGNMLHAYAIGLVSRAGEKNGRAKLTREDVLNIRISQLTKKTLAEFYLVCERTIYDIKKEKTWKTTE